MDAPIELGHAVLFCFCPLFLPSILTSWFVGFCRMARILAAALLQSLLFFTLSSSICLCAMAHRNKVLMMSLSFLVLCICLLVAPYILSRRVLRLREMPSLEARK